MALNIIQITLFAMLFLVIAGFIRSLITATPVHVAPYRVVDEKVKALEVRVKELEVKLDSLTKK